ncbi:MAG TPA: tetratricopeptide repeat protein [Ignavibacteriaceae bacterium]|nr:tetratricopeptide repeat protein [Ignavibacteriaceae bacterium]
MKKISKISVFQASFTFILIFLTICSGQSSANPRALLLSQGNPNDKYIQVDSSEILSKYSLFSEYFKNKDYKSAVPYGWEVIKLNPNKFAKWIYNKMDDALWGLHDAPGTTPAQAKAIEDSLIILYDLGMKNYPEGRGYLLARKTLAREAWFNIPGDSVIKAYETAIQLDPKIPKYYYDRLGQWYLNKNKRDKAIDLYSKWSSQEPNDTLPSARLKAMVKDPGELADIICTQWSRDKENTDKALECISLQVKANKYADAIPAMEFLVSKSPESVPYWNQLAILYQKTDQFQKAEDVYKKLITLEPNNQNHFLNLGIVYRDKGQLALARTQFERAYEIANGWAQALYNEGYLYELAARNCTFDFDTKLVYQLAVDTYKKALHLDSYFTEARDRIASLASFVPTQEDYFVRGYKSGQNLAIPGNSCYSWIGKSITVP